MVDHSLLRYSRWGTIVVACVLITVATQNVVPVPRASSASLFHIELTIEDPTSGGPITQNDTLIVTARIFENGVRARSGEITVSTNSPTKRYLCEIESFPYSRDSCKTYLPQAGLWQVVARLSSSKFPPWHYVASVSLFVNVMSEGLSDNYAPSDVSTPKRT
jgi:hypothetical protein